MSSARRLIIIDVMLHWYISRYVQRTDISRVVSRFTYRLHTLPAIKTLLGCKTLSYIHTVSEKACVFCKVVQKRSWENDYEKCVQMLLVYDHQWTENVKTIHDEHFHVRYRLSI